MTKTTTFQHRIVFRFLVHKYWKEIQVQALRVAKVKKAFFTFVTLSAWTWISFQFLSLICS